MTAIGSDISAVLSVAALVTLRPPYSQYSRADQVEGRPPVTLKAGEVLFIPAGAVHSAKNVGSSIGKELATYIVEKGKPLLTLAK